jgi:hypothetical protein
MDATREPYPMEVHLHRFEIVGGAVASIMKIDGFEAAADAQVIFSFLVEEDVPSFEGCLREIIDEFLLAERQLFEAVDTIAENLYVSEFFQ